MPHLDDTESVRAHFANIEKINAEIASKILALESQYELTLDNNKKDAEKKKQENDAFNDAISLACLISEIRLFKHFEKIIERIIAKAEEQELLAKAQHSQRAESTDLSRNPYPPMLPQKNEAPDKYLAQALKESSQLLANVQETKKEIETQLKNDWGATTWEAGLDRQLGILKTDTITRQNDVLQKFSAVILEPRINESGIKEPGIDELLNAANNELVNRINKQRPTPIIKLTLPEDITVGAEAPTAPPMLTTAMMDAFHKKVAIHFSPFDHETELVAIQKKFQILSNHIKPNTQGLLKAALYLNDPLVSLLKKMKNFENNARHLNLLAAQETALINTIKMLSPSNEKEHDTPTPFQTTLKR